MAAPPLHPDDASLGDLVRLRVSRLLAELSGTPIEGLHPALMREVEEALVETVLAHTGGQREAAARILGLHRNSLRLRLRALGLERPARTRRRRRRA